MSEINNKEHDAPSMNQMTPNELKKTVKIQELPSVYSNHITPAGISRERSFVRPTNPQSHQQVSEC